MSVPVTHVISAEILKSYRCKYTRPGVRPGLSSAVSWRNSTNPLIVLWKDTLGIRLSTRIPWLNFWAAWCVCVLGSGGSQPVPWCNRVLWRTYLVRTYRWWVRWNTFESSTSTRERTSWSRPVSDRKSRARVCRLWQVTCWGQLVHALDPSVGRQSVSKLLRDLRNNGVSQFLFLVMKHVRCIVLL